MQRYITAIKKRFSMKFDNNRTHKQIMHTLLLSTNKPSIINTQPLTIPHSKMCDRYHIFMMYSVPLQLMISLFQNVRHFFKPNNYISIKNLKNLENVK